MSLSRIWHLAQFELTRLFATKRGLLALAAFSMVWFIILKYPINQAVSYLNDPDYSQMLLFFAGNIGLSHLVSQPEAELMVFWLIALYCFPIFCLFICADQTVEDRLRGTLRFISLRCTRSEILLGRFLGQALILTCLITLTVLATLLLMTTRSSELFLSGLNISIQYIVQLTLIVLPFIALMSLLNLIARSARLTIILAILIFSVGHAIIGFIIFHFPILSGLNYVFPGVQLENIASQIDTALVDWLIPALQTGAILALSTALFKRRSL